MEIIGIKAAVLLDSDVEQIATPAFHTTLIEFTGFYGFYGAIVSNHIDSSMHVSGIAGGICSMTISLSYADGVIQRPVPTAGAVLGGVCVVPIKICVFE